MVIHNRSNNNDNNANSNTANDNDNDNDNDDDNVSSSADFWSRCAWYFRLAEGEAIKLIKDTKREVSLDAIN